MNNEEKIYSWVEPYVTRQELIQILVKGLERALTHQEARTVKREVSYWIYSRNWFKYGIDANEVYLTSLGEPFGAVRNTSSCLFLFTSFALAYMVDT